MVDKYKAFTHTPVSPARSAAPITPHNTNEISVCRLYVGTTGDIAVVLADDSTSVVLKSVSGFMPILVKQVLATGTTAADILGLY